MGHENQPIGTEWDIMVRHRHWEWIAARVERRGGTVDRSSGLIRWSIFWIWDGARDSSAPAGGPEDSHLEG